MATVNASFSDPGAHAGAVKVSKNLAWLAPLAHLAACLLGACSFPDVTIVDDPECLSDDDCTEGRRCHTEGRCVPCLTSSHCATGLVCTPEGQCAQCASAADCDADDICEPAKGTCVGCLSKDDCEGEEVCSAGHQCGPTHCADGDHDPELGEIAADCGGPCGPCELGTACRLDDDCQSGICQDDRCSLPCDNTAQCSELTDAYCNDDGRCAQRRALGVDCAEDVACLSGHCSRDGVCCEESCEQVCMGCRQEGMWGTGVESGQCVPLPEETEDPDCPAVEPVCDGGGSCSADLPI